MPNFNIYNRDASQNASLTYGVEINGQITPISVDQTGSAYVSTVASSHAIVGNYYSLTTGSLTVAANGYLVLQITNPANSGKTLNLSRVLGGATTATTIDILRNATFSAAGTTLTPRNTNWNYPDASVMTTKYLTQASDPTVGGTLLYSTIQGAGGNLAINYEGRVVMPSSPSTNRQLYLRLVNNTNQTNTLSISIGWWEMNDLH